MADPKGFLTHGRELPARRPVDVRIRDWREVYEDFPRPALTKQAARCMDCGIPFCHNGCPLGNLIPEWNDLVYRDDWREAIERLHATWFRVIHCFSSTVVPDSARVSTAVWCFSARPTIAGFRVVVMSISLLAAASLGYADSDTQSQ